jgi:hypothetical protein
MIPHMVLKRIDIAPSEAATEVTLGLHGEGKKMAALLMQKIGVIA